MLLYVLRHGDAVQNSALHDSERPLTERGESEAQTVARFIRKANLRVECILTSPLLRARQTAEPLQRLLPIDDVRTTEYLVPGTDSRQLFEVLRGLHAEHVLLVGHEPLLGSFIAELTGATVPPEIKKSSLACVALPSPVQRGRGVLKWLITIDLMQLCSERS